MVLLIVMFALMFDNVLTTEQSKWVDMSHSYDANTLSWGANTRFNKTVVHDGKVNDQLPYYLNNDISLNEHSGTHIDAPIHFSKGKWSVDQIPLDKLIGRAIVVNISEKASKDRNALLKVADLKVWENSYGPIPDNSIVLGYTGWGKYWPNYKDYFGTDTKNSSLYRFPGIDTAAAKWLIANRKINGVGIDTPSIDYGKSKIFLTHQILFKENIFGLENVANMDKLPAKGATVYVMPMLVKGGSGAPVRIIANLHDGSDVSLGSTNVVNMILIFLSWFYLVLI